MLRDGLIALVLFLFSFLAFANEEPLDYRTTLIVKSQQESERQQQFREGLYQLLETLTGQLNLENHPDVKEAAAHITSFVDQYSYEGNRLTIQYSPSLVRTLASKLGQITLQSQRPSLMMWLVIENGEGKRLIGEDNDPGAVNLLKNVARDKGFNIVLPILDLEEVSRIDANMVWSLNIPTLQEASMRYGAKSILVGRLQNGLQANATWKANWTLISHGQTKSFTSLEGSLEAVIKQGIDNFAQDLTNSPRTPSTFVQTPQQVISPKPYLLLVENLQSGQDFSRAQAILRNLGPIGRVSVAEILGESAVFEITLKPDQPYHALIQALSLNENLMAKNRDPSSSISLAYRFNR